MLQKAVYIVTTCCKRLRKRIRRMHSAQIPARVTTAFTDPDLCQAFKTWQYSMSRWEFSIKLRSLYLERKIRDFFFFVISKAVTVDYRTHAQFCTQISSHCRLLNTYSILYTKHPQPLTVTYVFHVLRSVADGTHQTSTYSPQTLNHLFHRGSKA
jgi:hypothetical protein